MRPRPIVKTCWRRWAAGRAVAVLSANAGRASAGVADLRGGLLLADVEFRITGRFQGFTRFTLFSPRGAVTVSVPGVYMIWDSRPGLGVLFGSTDPVPHVFVVQEDSLLAALTRPTKANE